MARILGASLLSVVLVAGCAAPAGSPSSSSAPPTQPPAATQPASPVATVFPSPSPVATAITVGPMSPAAEQLLVYVNGDGDFSAVRSVRADGQQDRHIVAGDSPAWSLDGRFIAYRCRSASGPLNICVMNADGTSSHVVLSDAIAPSWSPDGTRILFSRSVIDAGDTWVANADGASPRQIGPGAGSWSPDGSQILLLGASGAAPDATVVRPDGTGARKLGDCWNAVWSPDSKRLLCTVWDGVHGSLRAIDVGTGSGATLFTTDAGIDNLAPVTLGLLAFTMTRPGSNPSAVPAENDLYLLDITTQAPRKLTSGLLIRGPIDVSSDGAWLTFAVPAGAGTDVASNDVYIASTSGEVRRLTTSGVSRSPSWRPLPAPPQASATRVGLMVRWYSCDDVCAFTPGTVVLEDGRVIWQTEVASGTEATQAYRVRWLAGDGLVWVKAQLDATGLLAKSAAFSPTVVPGATPPASGMTANTFLLERAGRRITVVSVVPPGQSADPGVWVIPPETRVLAALAANLKDPEAWIPASAWATLSAPFLPQHYLLFVHLAPGQPDPTATIDADAVAWPFGPIDAAGSPYAFQPGGIPVPNGRCVAISAAQATAMAAAENKAGANRELDQRISAAQYAWSRGKGSISVETRWLLPYQSLDCSDAIVW